MNEFNFTHVIEGFVQDLLPRDLTNTPKGSYKPCLIVGIGGTGVRAIRHLKGLLHRHPSPHVRLWAIDTDRGEQSKYPPTATFPALDKELAILSQSEAAQYLDLAATGEREYSRVLEYLPKHYGEYKNIHAKVKSKIASEHGAGQFRRAGKLLFYSNLRNGQNLMVQLSTIRHDLTSIPTVVRRLGEGVEVQEGTTVYVVSSVAGGTGAGCLVDALALLRMYFNGKKDTVTAFCLLPGELLYSLLDSPPREKPIVQANALGALREIYALQQGELGGEFVFADERIKAKSAAVNAVYLIDQRDYKNASAENYMDVCRAVGSFLYSLVGTSVGASQQSGDVNDPMLPEGAKTKGRIFNSLGVGAIEYPVIQLWRYAVLKSLGAWLPEWLQAAETKANVAAQARSAFLDLTSGLETAIAGSPSLDFVNRTFLGNEGDLQEVMRKDDYGFIRACDDAVESVTSQLRNQASDFERNSLANKSKFVKEVLEHKVCEWIARGPFVAEQILKQLKADIASYSAETATEDRERARQKREQEFAKLAKWIHRLDPDFLDRGKRKQYISLLKEHLLLEVSHALAPHIRKCADEIVSVIEAQLRQVAHMRQQAQTCRKQLDGISATILKEKGSAFVQRLLESADFEKWWQTDGKSISVVMPERCESLGLSDVLRAAVGSIAAPYATAVAQLNVVAAAAKDEHIRRRVVSIERASLPLIKLNSSRAPVEGKMNPRKYVAGAIEEGDDELTKHFQSVGSSSVKLLPTGNPQLLLCVRTFSGFGIKDWEGFNSCLKAYNDRKWYAHALPNNAMDKLPDFE